MINGNNPKFYKSLGFLTAITWLFALGSLFYLSQSNGNAGLTPLILITILLFLVGIAEVFILLLSAIGDKAVSTSGVSRKISTTVFIALVIVAVTVSIMLMF